MAEKTLHVVLQCEALEQGATQSLISFPCALKRFHKWRDVCHVQRIHHDEFIQDSVRPIPWAIFIFVIVERQYNGSIVARIGIYFTQNVVPAAWRGSPNCRVYKPQPPGSRVIGDARRESFSNSRIPKYQTVQP